MRITDPPKAWYEEDRREVMKILEAHGIDSTVTKPVMLSVQLAEYVQRVRVAAYNHEEFW